MSCESTDFFARSHLAVQEENKIIPGRGNRLDWVDVAKGIGILSVIAGHMGVGAINRIVFPWHMPLFFILSGVFLSGKLEIRSFIRAKGRALLIPFAYTALVLIVLEFLWGVKAGGLDASAFRRAGYTLISALLGSGSASVFGFGPIGAIWFLQALFIALVINRMVLSKHCLWIVMFLAIIGAVSSRIVWLPFNIQSGFLASLFVFLGVRFKRFILASPSSLLCLVGALCLMASLMVKPRNLCVVTCSGNLLFYCLSPLIVYFVLVVARGLDTIPLLRHIFTFFGRNSLMILCLHLIELNEMPWRKIMLLCGNRGGGVMLFVLKIFFVSTGVLALKWINSRFGFRKENARGAC